MSQRLTAVERRAQIAQAAEGIARESGLRAITLRAVAAKVGVVPALVAHYAPSVDVLVADTFEQIVAAELAEIRRLADRYDSPTAQLGAVIATLLSGERAAVTHAWVQSWTLGGHNEVLGHRVREQMDHWQDFIEQIVRRGCRIGQFTVAEPSNVAWQILGMIDGLNAQSLVHWRDATQRAQMLARSAEVLLGTAPGTLSEQRPAGRG
jgi:AcrR family transcriptional regulator